VAISRVIGTAMRGRSKERPELAQTPLSLSGGISVLSCREGEGFLRRLFEPLGYSVRADPHPLDEEFPEWGESRYFSVGLSGEVRLQELLSHLYVLVPVLDDDKHYWVGEDEVDKLLRHSGEWLAGHPEKEVIAERYLKHRSTLSNEALSRLTEEEEAEGLEREEEALEEIMLSESLQALEAAASSGRDVGALLGRYRQRMEAVDHYVDAYRRYSWPVLSLDDLRIAPFHLLATEGEVHTDKDHGWHMKMLARLCEADASLLLATSYTTVETTDPESMEAGIRWWEEITGRGGEGMVVKPLDFVVRGRRGLVQPGVKCRGREYLRIIYGPEYTAPGNLERLRTRRLGTKRSLALREFALGVEALERFVRREPLYRVHECVFGVLALESEPVDPRL